MKISFYYAEKIISMKFLPVLNIYFNADIYLLLESNTRYLQITHILVHVCHGYRVAEMSDMNMWEFRENTGNI